MKRSENAHPKNLVMFQKCFKEHCCYYLPDSSHFIQDLGCSSGWDHDNFVNNVLINFLWEN